MNFLLFSEGPLYKLYQWTGLAKKHYKQRILIICLLAWLPLVILTFLTHDHFKSFMRDVDVHVRLLISLAILLYAEVIANERFQIVIRQFLKCHIISERDHKKYETMIARALQFSGSAAIELLLLIFVITIGRWISNHIRPFDISVWYAVKQNNMVNLTLPGYWYAFVSLPIFQFILMRWYYRIIIWYGLLWRISKLKLQLNSLHPDKAGGIGFLVNSIYGLEPFLMAHSFLLAGIILNYILNAHALLWDFRNEMLTWVIILLFIPLIPMIFFVIKLARVKRNGTNEFDVVANRYVTDFRKKWIDEASQHDAQLLGTPDIQSLADLSNSFNVSAQMRVIPFAKSTILFILIFTLLPFLPLIFTVIPLEQILKQVVSIVF